MSGLGRLTHVQSWLPWLAGIIIAFMVLSVGKLAVKRYNIEREIKAHEKEVLSQEVRQQELLEILKYVQSPTYAEEQARLKFGLAKPGEKLAVVSEGSGAEENNLERTPAGPSTGGGPQANYDKWWRYFFDSNDQ